MLEVYWRDLSESRKSADLLEDRFPGLKVFSLIDCIGLTGAEDAELRARARHELASTLGVLLSSERVTRGVVDLLVELHALVDHESIELIDRRKIRLQHRFPGPLCQTAHCHYGGKLRNYTSQQKHLAAIEVDTARVENGKPRKGGRGDGVTILDAEFGWYLGHRDLPSTTPKTATGAEIWHGAKVLSVMGGQLENGLGMEGVAPGATFKLLRLPAAEVAVPLLCTVLSAERHIGSGDVLTLPVEFSGEIAGRRVSNMPLESFSSGRDVIRYLTDAGIHFVQAAGNNPNCLDASNATDSIMVSACDYDHQCLLKKVGRGSRVDLVAQGEGVVAVSNFYGATLYRCGDDDSYTCDFGGTSSATAIVGGVVALVAAICYAMGRVLGPAEMKSHLMKSATILPGDKSRLPNLRTVLGSI